MNRSFRQLYRQLLLGLVAVTVLTVLQTSLHGQTPVATPPPPPPAPTPSIYEALRRSEEDIRRRANLEGARDARFGRVDRARQQRSLARQIDALYREPNREEKKLLRPTEDFYSIFRSFLKLSNTGLIKLIKDQGCSDSTVVIVASEHCLKHSMPGSGSSYSFRTKSHRISRLSDITFSNGKFQALGSLVRGILVDLGNIPMEEVSLQSIGSRFLRDYSLTNDVSEAIKADREFAAGKSFDGFVYARSVPARMDTTYMLRSVAYQGSFYKAVDGLAYNEFAFDNRRDVTVAFRIVGEDADGITIIYRQLNSKKSPTIKLPNKSESILDTKFTADRPH